MQNFILTNSYADMTSLVCLVAIQPADVFETSVIIDPYFINRA